MNGGCGEHITQPTRVRVRSASFFIPNGEYSNRQRQHKVSNSSPLVDIVSQRQLGGWLHKGLFQHLPWPPPQKLEISNINYGVWLSGIQQPRSFPKAEPLIGEAQSQCGEGYVSGAGSLLRYVTATRRVTDVICYGWSL